MKTNKKAARAAIEIAELCYKEPAAKNPFLSSAQHCIDSAEQCFEREEYKAAAAWAKKAIGHTHGFLHPILSMFDHID
jgi:hypothetical protein